MKLKLLAALLFVAAPAAAQPPRASAADRRHLGRPILRRSVRPISPAFHRWPQAACQRHRFPRGLSVARRDRDLPRPFDHPHRRPPRPDRDRRQQLVRSRRRARRTNTSIARRTSASPAAAPNITPCLPFHLRVPTLGDLMHRADPRSRVVAVAGKDRAAVMMGGHRPNERWWWGGRASSAMPARAPPVAVREVNGACRRNLARPREAMDLPGDLRSAQPRHRRAGADHDGRHGPLRARRGRPQRLSRLARIRRRDPRSRPWHARRDAARPRARRPTSSPSACRATDYVGHGFGTEGSEMCIQLLALDRAARRLLPGARPRPDRLCRGADRRSWRPRSARADRAAGRRRPPAPIPRSAPRRWARRSAAASGCRGPCCSATACSATSMSTGRCPRATRARVLTEAVAAYRAHPQVDAVFTRAADRRDADALRPARSAGR